MAELRGRHAPELIRCVLDRLRVPSRRADWRGAANFRLLLERRGAEEDRDADCGASPAVTVLGYSALSELLGSEGRLPASRVQPPNQPLFNTPP